jgi:hypothetical protein
MVVGPVTPLKLRSGFVPFETFQSSKLGLSWNFGTGKVGQLVCEGSCFYSVFAAIAAWVETGDHEGIA